MRIFIFAIGIYFSLLSTKGFSQAISSETNLAFSIGEKVYEAAPKIHDVVSINYFQKAVMILKTAEKYSNSFKWLKNEELQKLFVSINRQDQNASYVLKASMNQGSSSAKVISKKERKNKVAKTTAKWIAYIVIGVTMALGVLLVYRFWDQNMRN